MPDSKRKFSPDDIPEKAEDYHGSCQYITVSPDLPAKGVPGINIGMTFEDAMQLSVSLQSAIMKLNRFSRRTTAGKNMGVGLFLDTNTKSIKIMESEVKPAAKSSK